MLHESDVENMHGDVAPKTKENQKGDCNHQNASMSNQEFSTLSELWKQAQKNLLETAFPIIAEEVIGTKSGLRSAILRSWLVHTNAHAEGGSTLYEPDGIKVN